LNDSPRGFERTRCAFPLFLAPLILLKENMPVAENQKEDDGKYKGL
jgi:hypothetical protein